MTALSEGASRRLSPVVSSSEVDDLEVDEVLRPEPARATLTGGESQILMPGAFRVQNRPKHKQEELIDHVPTFHAFLRIRAP